jgi:hypothetical protein
LLWVPFFVSKHVLFALMIRSHTHLGFAVRAFPFKTRLYEVGVHMVGLLSASF